jgi:carboxylate-amine ligase
VQIDFNSSPGPSLGIEVELEVVDRGTRELASVATDVLAVLGDGHPDGEHPKAKHELFECTIEIITGVCHSVAEARADLEATLAELRTETDPRGLELLCSGSHPFSHPQDQVVSPNPRYARLVHEMQWMAKRLQIFGVHVHVGVRSPEKAVAISGALAGYIPHLLALTASSPYWEGEDTGLASCRSKVFEGMPTAGLPAPIENWEDFERFMGTLIESAAISSIREVWWDIRPHPDFGTVELRMCDGIPTMSEIGAIAAMAQCLVGWLDAQYDRGVTLPRHHDWLLRQNKWRAGRHGLESELIMDVSGRTQPLRAAVEDVLADLAPIAQRLDCDRELARIEGIVRGGASYSRQRRAAAAAETPGDLRPVVDQLVAELRTDVPGAVR